MTLQPKTPAEDSNIEEPLPDKISSEKHTSDGDRPEAITASKEDNRFRSQDIIFAFGPNDSYFISTSITGWLFDGSNSLCAGLNEKEIHKPIAIALTPDVGFVFVYELEDGSSTVQMMDATVTLSSESAVALAERTKEYKRLYDFLRADKDTDVRRKLTFSIGPHGSWFAKRGDDVAHNGIPKALRLEMKVKAAENVRPTQITLGINGSYVALWTDASTTWEVRGYHGLHEVLEQDDSHPNTVILSPCNNNEWFLVQNDGQVMWRLQGSDEKLEKIQKLANGFMQREARRSGKQYIMRNTDGDVVITPDTKLDYSHSDAVNGDYGSWKTRASGILDRVGLSNMLLSTTQPESRSNSMDRQVQWASDMNRKSLIAAGAAGLLAGMTSWYGRPPAPRIGGGPASVRGTFTRLFGTPFGRTLLVGGTAACGAFAAYHYGVAVERNRS